LSGFKGPLKTHHFWGRFFAKDLVLWTTVVVNDRLTSTYYSTQKLRVNNCIPLIGKPVVFLDSKKKMYVGRSKIKLLTLKKIQIAFDT
jgi:hypothetical protein